jgi:hypothetical protein
MAHWLIGPLAHFICYLFLPLRWPKLRPRPQLLPLPLLPVLATLKTKGLILLLIFGEKLRSALAFAVGFYSYLNANKKKGHKGTR